ncbi:MAG: D-alanyl-D-alanine carboxypeptidase/D-alanyl-D-alanine-endopeptidase [Chitinophagaceae bacterium]|nr:MAG: D-alanyl-D-alanine carboxypeptidase/D-alanyl-D-alanine-endopeptidase [Chitinophagaceae bacterium]
MKRTVSLFCSVLLLGTVVSAQPVPARLAQAWQRFVQDSQLQAGVASLYVVEAGTGQVVFEQNARLGLAPASTQKVITAATAYEVLGPDFRYSTVLAATGRIEGGMLNGSLRVIGNGDPSLGSWRWKSTGTDSVLARWTAAVQRAGIRSFGDLSVQAAGQYTEAIPGGWTWQDIGQYYGAGARALNWHENQFDLELAPGKSTGDSVRMLRVSPDPMQPLALLVTTAAAGTGDNSYFFQSVGSGNSQGSGGIKLRGTLPAGKPITVSGSLPDPEATLLHDFGNALRRRGVQVGSPVQRPDPGISKEIYREDSPPLDSLSFWFLRRSINLYGEAFLKSIALSATGVADTEKGAGAVRDFWKGRGVNPAELHLIDGSGLSPENRVSTRAQVQVLQWARSRPWFAGYVNGFPTYNDMKMKSGTISRVKGFCGYHRARDGKEYTFSFIVNNFEGSASSIVRKMYAVLDELK